MNRIFSSIRKIGLAAGILLLFSGCSLVEVRQDAIMFFVAGEVDIETHQKLLELIIYEVEDVAAPSIDWLNIYYLDGDRVVNQYSSRPEKRALWSLVKAIPTLESMDQALVSALYSLLAIAQQNPEMEIQAVLISDGTVDETVIASLAGASEKLSQYENVSISVLGVDPSKRSDFSRGFAPIPAQVTFSSSPEELATKFRSIGG